jgi:hypothetical protein
VLVSQQATIPGIISPGQTISVTALQTTEGTKTTSPAANAAVTVQFISNGAIAYNETSLSNSKGLVTFTVPSSLPLGSYIISLWTSTAGSSLYNPLTQAVQLSAASSSSSTATSTSVSSSSTTAATSSSNTDYYVLAAVVVVVIVLVGVALTRRKR